MNSKEKSLNDRIWKGELEEIDIDLDLIEEIDDSDSVEGHNNIVKKDMALIRAYGGDPSSLSRELWWD